MTRKQAINPALINHELDDSEYEHAAPTIGTMMLAHFSTPEKQCTVVYGADGLFFATNPSQRMYFRPAFRNEFDIYTTEEEFEQRPMLWVLVILLSPGHHMRLPVWRGHAFWNGIEADQATAEVLMQMCERRGINLAEWYSFISDQRIRKSYKSQDIKKAN